MPQASGNGFRTSRFAHFTSSGALRRQEQVEEEEEEDDGWGCIQTAAVEDWVHVIWGVLLICFSVLFCSRRGGGLSSHCDTFPFLDLLDVIVFFLFLFVCNYVHFQEGGLSSGLLSTDWERNRSNTHTKKNPKNNRLNLQVPLQPLPVCSVCVYEEIQLHLNI